MTTSTASPVVRTRAPRLTWAGIVRSEWLRLVTTRWAVVTLVAAGVVMALLGVLAAAVSTGSVADPSGGPAPGFESSDPLSTVTAGSTLVVLVLGVLGVVLGAREHSSGLVRTTYAAVPRRWPVLAARALVLTVASTVTVGLGTAVAYGAGTAVLSSADAATVGLGDDGVVRALLGTVGYLVGTGLLGLALGTLARSVGTGTGLVVALVLVLPGFGSLLLPDSWQGALDYLPSEAATSVASLDGGGLGVAAGAVVFLAWVVGLLAAATAGLLRRDV